MNDSISDVLIVGGGPAGAAAATALVNDGLKVSMVDGGNITKSPEFESQDFETLRRNYLDQYRLFLGEDFSGINLLSKTHISSQASGNKKYLLEGVQKFLPVKTSNVEIMQNLAKGGLTEIWGGNCDFFDRTELITAGLPPDEMVQHYQKIIDLIGVSGISSQYKLQPPALIDENAKQILKNYRKQISKFRKLDFEIHQPYLSVLTERKDGRQPIAYNDTEYWLENGRAVYRARYTIENLEKRRNFNYHKGVVVSINENNNRVIVTTNNRTFKTKIVVLASGPLSTGRILMKSYSLYNMKFPFLSKYHIISPSILLTNIGKTSGIRKHSFCQLVMTSKDTKSENYSYTQFYSYKSLLLFKLLKFSKLPIPESLFALSLLSSSLVLADTRFGSAQDQGGECFLEKNKSREVLNVIFKNDSKDQKLNDQSFKNVKKAFRSLGLLTIKHSIMPYGSTSHYAGTLSGPLAKQYLGLSNDGKLERSRSVYVADSSGWQSLPAKPPTLTIMANAHRIAKNITLRLKSSY